LTTLMITRGLPASGKTTRARAWVAENPAGRARLNRDDFRLMVHEGYISRETEAVISSAQHGAARTLLLAGIDVVADDTNLKPKATLAWEEVAARAGAALVIWDLTNVPLDVCIARDAARTGNAHVGEQAIRDMHDTYIAEPQPQETK
jgi:predicted kinase